METNDTTMSINKETLWYLDNYLVLRDYYDRTISRIAARCVRMGNIAMEEYPFYGYIPFLQTVHFQTHGLHDHAYLLCIAAYL